MVDNPMLDWDDAPEWEMITAWYCDVCKALEDGPTCNCETEEYHGGEVDAVICPYCRQIVLGNDEACDEHSRDCYGQSDYDGDY